MAANATWPQADLWLAVSKSRSDGVNKCKNPVLASPNARKWVYSTWQWAPNACWAPDARFLCYQYQHVGIEDPMQKSPDAKFLADPMWVISLYSTGFFYALGAKTRVRRRKIARRKQFCVAVEYRLKGSYAGCHTRWRGLESHIFCTLIGPFQSHDPVTSYIRLYLHPQSLKDRQHWSRGIPLYFTT